MAVIPIAIRFNAQKRMIWSMVTDRCTAALNGARHISLLLLLLLLILILIAPLRYQLYSNGPGRMVGKTEQ